MVRKRDGVGRALRRALGEPFVLPEIEPRESGASILMNPRRQEVLEFVWNRPGSHLRRIARELRIPPQSLRWHLLRLRKERILASRVVKGKTVYYAPWAIREEDVPLFAALSNGVRGKIVAVVRRSAPVPQSAIFRALNTYQQAVLPPLGDLTRLGLLRTWKEDGKRLYALGEAYGRLEAWYVSVAPQRIEQLLAVLRHDGVTPKVQSRGGDEVVVQVSCGAERNVLTFRVIPAMA